MKTLLSSSMAGFFMSLATVCSPSFAVTSQYTAPSLHGTRLDYCAHFGKDCGKPAADLFCKELGFTSATAFSIDPNIGGRGVSTLVFGDGRTCTGPTCSGFRSITCTKPDVAALPPGRTLTPALPTTSVPPAGAATRQLNPTNPAGAGTGNAPGTGSTAGASIPLRTPPPPPGGSGSTSGANKPGGGTAVAGSNKPPTIVLPAGARLYHCVQDPQGDSCGLKYEGFEIDSKAVDQVAKLRGDVSMIGGATGFRWQASTAPFPAYTGGSPTIPPPPSLVAAGVVAAKVGDIAVDLKKLVPTGKPLPNSFYFRILPVPQTSTSGGGNVQQSSLTPSSVVLAGQPSNTVRVYYTAQLPQPDIKIVQLTDPQLFSVKLLDFSPAILDDPNRWGCVTVVGYKPADSLQLVSPQDVYPVGTEICPDPYEGEGYTCTSFGDCAKEALHFYTAAYGIGKDFVVDVIMKYTGFGALCEAAAKGEPLKLSAANAQKYCRMAVKTGVDIGLAAVGIPPELPTYEDIANPSLEAAADKAAQALIGANIPCNQLCHDALEAGFKAAAKEAWNKIKENGYAPGCTDDGTAHDHGRQKLCAPDGVIVMPAPGSVLQWPVAIVEVTRLNGDRDPKINYNTTCKLNIATEFNHVYPNGLVLLGPSGKSTTFPVASSGITGSLFYGSGTDLDETMAKGSTRTYAAMLTKAAPFEFIETKQLWAGQQAQPFNGIYGQDWRRLYYDSLAIVQVSSACSTNSSEGKFQMPSRPPYE